MRVLFALLFLWLSGCASDQLDAGVLAFDDGSLPQAIEAWEGIEGDLSAAAHYNAGVARYRQDDVPRAIAHWRSAAQLRPRSPDIAHNLALARSRLSGRAPTPVGAQVGWMNFATAGELGLLALLLLCAASATGWRWRRRGGRAAQPIGLSAVGLLLAVGALQAAWLLSSQPIAIVVDNPAVVRDAAAIHGAELLELSPGSEVAVQRRTGDFLLIRTADGHAGWIPVSTAVLVGPR